MSGYGARQRRRPGWCALVLVAALSVWAASAASALADSVIRVTSRVAISGCATGILRPHAGAKLACHTTVQPGNLISPVAGVLSYQNPVSGVAPDPFAMVSRSQYYLYSTGDLFPIETSPDLVHWRPVGTAFVRKPSWVAQTGDWHPWAPSVVQSKIPCPLATLLGDTLFGHQPLGSTCYYLFYVGLSAKYDTNCIAVATSTSPSGPFVDGGPLSNGQLDALGRPVGCGDSMGFGNIDPDPYVDSNGQAYLYMSTDWFCPYGTTTCDFSHGRLVPTISVFRLTPDLLRVVGERRILFGGNQHWEKGPSGTVVEGPWLEKHDGVYHLFYSGGDWVKDYGMGDAILSTPLGPVHQDPINPILAGNKRVYSPGGGTTTIGPRGGEWMVYHARLGGYNKPRVLFIDPVVWYPNDSVKVRGPTSSVESPGP